MSQTRDSRSALATFRRHGGVLRTGQALARGIHPATLYRLHEEGKLTRLTRGLYRLAQSPEFSNPDLAVIATKAPRAVVCLISALAFHGITTQVPRFVHLAVPRGGYSRLTIGSPPVRVYRFDVATFNKGIEDHEVDGRPIRVYGVARSVVDCFKYRNKIGLDVALEALHFARERKRIGNRELLEIARALRLDRVIRSVPASRSVTEHRKNVVASVLARLRNVTDQGGHSFNDVLQAYVIERFLARLAQSPEADTLLLKGALMLRVWGVPRARPTMDIDVMHRGAANRNALAAIVRKCASTVDESDGVAFDADNMRIERIHEEGGYIGTRIRVPARLANVRQVVQIDFGVGDAVYPSPVVIEYPVLLGGTPLKLRAYPVEAAIAEKFQAMLQLDLSSSRMKDFYDVWILSQALEFDGQELSKSIQATFERRETPIPTTPPAALTERFSAIRCTRGSGMLSQQGLMNRP